VLLTRGWIRSGGSHPWNCILTEALGPERQFHAAAGRVVRRLEEIAESGKAVAETLDRSFLLPSNRIVTVLARPVRTASEPEIQEWARKLYYALDIGNETRALELLKATGTAMCQFYTTEAEIKTCFAKLLTMLINLISVDRIPVDVDRYFAMVTLMFKQTDFEGIFRTVESVLSILREAIGRSGQDILVKQIVDFIDRHYRDNLKLDVLAEVFNYNPGYMGKLFKRRIGVSFHAYMDRIRIERAIELLKEGCKVQQAAELVGYSNVDYFYAKFKKYKDVPPSSYKSLEEQI
jgi:two-component system response regulator YesN